MNKNKAIIKFVDANIANGENIVLYGLNMEVHKGDFIYIVGKVGTGKTSIIRTITAENSLESGEGYVCDYDLNKIKNKEIPYLRRKIGVIFQDFQLLMDRSVYANLEFVLRATGWKDEEKIKNRIDEVLDDVKMNTKAHKMPHQLSGGEQQRIAIARSLLNKPSLILADEPTGNLDAETAEGIMNLLVNINKENDTAIVMVTHNRELYHKYKGKVMLCADEACHEISLSQISNKETNEGSDKTINTSSDKKTNEGSDKTIPEKEYDFKDILLKEINIKEGK